MEIAGGLASISQLAHYGLSSASILLELYKSINRGPEFVQQYRNSIQQLLNIVDLVRHNKLLQSQSIEDILASILAEASELQSVLGQTREASVGKKLERLKITWTIFIKEQEIKDVFTSLEKKKSTLVLHIGEKNVRLLESIHSGAASLDKNLLDEVQNLTYNVQSTFGKGSEFAQRINKLSADLPSVTSSIAKIQTTLRPLDLISYKVDHIYRSLNKSKRTDTFSSKHSATPSREVIEKTYLLEMAGEEAGQTAKEDCHSKHQEIQNGQGKSPGRKLVCSNGNACNAQQHAGSSTPLQDGDDFECRNLDAENSVQTAGSFDEKFMTASKDAMPKKTSLKANLFSSA